ncbi:MAG TPA: phosphatidylserine decarboxylase family protein [Bacteroidota bacterium]|nr:phosphatidylserine decarboxylase family protein [Bacteroidota bacterium]
MITNYGYDVFFTITAVCAVLILCSYFFVSHVFLKYALIGAAGLFFLFTAYFFRDPERVTPQGDNLIISPADGTVIGITEVDEDIFLHGKAIQVSIFMSPLNVHVNRIPVTGTVRYMKHIPGEYFAAFEDKASLKNEQTHIGIEHPGGFRVFFKQIAGFVARRIVCPLAEGDQVNAGHRFGMIKFGSRVDIFVPASATINLKLQQKTVAGETVVATVH